MKSLVFDISLPFALVALIISFACLFIARNQETHAKTLTGDGQLAIAELVDKTTFTSSGTHKYAGFGPQGATTYTLHYKFPINETGEVHEARSNVSPEIWQSMQIGLRYQIIYSPKEPDLASLFDGKEFVSGARLAYRMSAVCFILGLAFLGVYWKLKT